MVKKIKMFEEENLDSRLYDESADCIESAEDLFLSGMMLPKQKFIGKSLREFLVRIKLKNAPVDVWRELVVPSNISLEMLAYVLLDAMGWEHEHLYQYEGKDNNIYLNAIQIKMQEEDFMFFGGRASYNDSEKVSLEMVLQPKSGRIKFEYDFGDSWVHELWVKKDRVYEEGEEPVVKLLKAKGACPPEDCGGVWGYEDLLYLNQKKSKTSEEKERLAWYGICSGFDPDDSELEFLQEDVDELWKRIKNEMK